MRDDDTAHLADDNSKPLLDAQIRQTSKIQASVLLKALEIW